MPPTHTVSPTPLSPPLPAASALPARLAAAASAVLLAACAPSPVETATAPSDAAAAPSVATADTSLQGLTADLDPLDWAISGPWRSEQERARDSARNPVETLSFFGVEPDDVVVELWPGGGWYSAILAPYLASGGGTLIAAGFDPDAYSGSRREQIEARLADYTARFSADPALFGQITQAAFSDRSGPLAAPASADVVLTFRNLHNWMAAGYADKAFTDAFAALKPGGTLGVVEHRLPSSDTQDPMAMTGYVHEDYVKAAAARAGFEFAGASEINANPDDTADHPFGVWTLPPNSRTQDRNGAMPEGFDPSVYATIGESDRMTLKFTKPDGEAPNSAEAPGASSPE